MYLVRQVLDLELVDRDGHKIGKVDDLVLELRQGQAPRVSAIRWGRGTLAVRLGPRISGASLWLRRRILGPAADRPPNEVRWEHVTHVDVAVHIDCDRDDNEMMCTDDAVWDRWLRTLPGAER